MANYNACGKRLQLWIPEGLAPQVQVRVPLKEKDPEGEVNCQYCGMKLTKEEQLTHSCKKKPKTM